LLGNPTGTSFSMLLNEDMFIKQGHRHTHIHIGTHTTIFVRMYQDRTEKAPHAARKTHIFSHTRATQTPTDRDRARREGHLLGDPTGSSLQCFSMRTSK
jgi:hypothetical protein